MLTTEERSVGFLLVLCGVHLAERDREPRVLGRSGPHYRPWRKASGGALRVRPQHRPRLNGSRPLLDQRHDWLVAASMAMVLVQAGDALVGLRIRDRFKTVGPSVTALLNLGLLIWYVAA